MSFDNSNKIALISGAVGGLLKYMQLLQVPSPFLVVIFRAVVVGLISGAAGYVGKQIVVYVKRRYYAKMVLYIKSKYCKTSKTESKK